MSSKLSGPRSKSILSETLDRRLKMYSLAASAAGVSILALAQPAHAEVVVTPKNLTVVAGASVYIDMTGEGRADFELVDHNSYPRYLELTPLAGREVVGIELYNERFSDFFASRLGSGAIVGPLAPVGGGSGAFLALSFIYGTCFSEICVTGVGSAGFWNREDTTAYLGVKVPIAGRIHYGWIRLAANFDIFTGANSAHITAYGYETEPDTPLVVPPVPSDETDNSAKQEGQNISEDSVRGPSLGMLALGAHGLALWRH